MTDPTPSDGVDRTSAAAASGAGVEVSGRQAAQGRSGSRTFVILIVSTLLIVVAMFGIYFLHLGALSTHKGAGPESGVTNHTEADMFHTPPPSPKPGVPGHTPYSRSAPSAPGAGNSGG